MQLTNYLFDLGLVRRYLDLSDTQHVFLLGITYGTLHEILCLGVSWCHRPDSCEDINLIAELLIQAKVEGQVERALPGCQQVMRHGRGS